MIVHGDIKGAVNVWRRLPTGWASGFRRRRHQRWFDRCIGDWKPYATGHAELEADKAIQGEVRNAARGLAEAAHALHGASRSRSAATWAPLGQE